MGSVGPAGQKGVPADARAVSDGCSGLRYAAGLLAGGIPTEFGFRASLTTPLVSPASHNAEPWHATEPAVGPESSGESSAPAR